jgi:hypothetical protein
MEVDIMEVDIATKNLCEINANSQNFPEVFVFHFFVKI